MLCFSQAHRNLTVYNYRFTMVLLINFPHDVSKKWENFLVIISKLVYYLKSQNNFQIKSNVVSWIL